MRMEQVQVEEKPKGLQLLTHYGFMQNSEFRLRPWRGIPPANRQPNTVITWSWESAAWKYGRFTISTGGSGPRHEQGSRRAMKRSASSGQKKEFSSLQKCRPLMHVYKGKDIT